ncbi:MAG TPA: hypothetical protein VIY90_21055 [Steroidobacteraceae bacterium]
MSIPIEPARQGRIDVYLKRLRQALAALPPEEVAEIVREIHGHIIERAESMDSLNEAALTRILSSLGNPEDIGSLYRSRAMVARARASTSPLLILRTTVRWAGKSIAGLVMSVFALFGYTSGLSCLVGATMKVIRPERVGLWVGPHTWDLTPGETFPPPSESASSPTRCLGRGSSRSCSLSAHSSSSSRR